MLQLATLSSIPFFVKHSENLSDKLATLSSDVKIPDIATVISKTIKSRFTLSTNREVANRMYTDSNSGNTEDT